MKENRVAFISYINWRKGGDANLLLFPQGPPLVDGEEKKGGRELPKDTSPRDEREREKKGKKKKGIPCASSFHADLLAKGRRPGHLFLDHEKAKHILQSGVGRLLLTSKGAAPRDCPGRGEEKKRNVS